MPITITIESRRIAKSRLNTKILQLWDNSEALVAEPVIANDKKKENALAQSNVENLKGIGNAILRKLDSYEIIHLFDGGQIIHIEKTTLELDTMANDLYESFNRFLNDVAEKIGLNSKMDADAYDEEEDLQEWYALIKTILLRMVLKILSNKAGKDGSSKKQLLVLRTFINGLSKIPELNANKSYIPRADDESPTEFSKFFLNDISDWKDKITLMVDEVELLNTTKNVVETNLEILNNVQKHTARFLYVRLQLVLGKIVKLSATTNDWLPCSLFKAEQEIIALLLNNQESLALQSVDALMHSPAISKERGTVVCASLLKLLETSKVKNLTDKEIRNITNLYEALYNITFMKNTVGLIDRLTTLTGCMAFLMKYINAEELERYINIYTKQCTDACTKEGLEKTNINTIVESNGEASVDIKRLPFTRLSDQKIQDGMSSYILAILGELTKNCKTNQCISIINEHNKLITSSTMYKQPILLENSEQPSKYTTFVRNADTSRNSILSCMDLTRGDMVKLFEQLKKEKTLWEYVKQEAYLVLRNKTLPYRLQLLINTNKILFDLEGYHKPFLSLYYMAEELREALRNANIDHDILGKSDHDLINKPDDVTTPFLKQHERKLKTYKSELNMSDAMLGKAVSNRDFILAYYQYMYVEEQSDLVYIPNTPTTIKAMAEYQKLGIIFSNVKTGLSHLEDDDCNSCKNPSRTIYIASATNTVVSPLINIPDQTIPHEPVQSKAKLYELIFEIQDYNDLDIEYKNTIFNYFLTESNTLSVKGRRGALKSLKEANNIIHVSREEGKDMDGSFVAAARKSVFDGMQPFIIKHAKRMKEQVYIQKAKSKYENLINNFLYEGIHSFYETLSATLKPQVYLNNIALLLLQDRNVETNEREFMGFRDDPLYCYMKNENDDYVSFKTSGGLGDEDYELNAIDIDLTDVINCVREAIINEENKKLLAFDICNELYVDSKEGFHDSKEWESLYKEHESHYAKVKTLRGIFNETGFSCVGTAEDFVAYLDSPAINAILSEQERDDLIELKKKMEILSSYNKKLLGYCENQVRINNYMEKLTNRECSVGKYALHLYARQMNISLCIYNKLSKKMFQEIYLDKITSLDLETSTSKVHVVFTQDNFYDKLIHISKDNTARMTADNYLLDLKRRITEQTSIFIPKPGQTLADYKLNFERCLVATNNEKMLSLEEVNKLSQTHEYIDDSKNWMLLLEQREKCYDTLSKERHVGLFFSRITELKDQMVLVDEPRDSKNRTLLCRAVENNAPEAMIVYLLGKDASMGSRNESNFTVILGGAEIQNDTYVLEKNTNNVWGLHYYNERNVAPVTINIEEVSGLRRLLNDKNMNEASLCQKSHPLIKPYHKKMQLKIPLLIMSKRTGFSQELPLYFTFLAQAQKEVSLYLNKKLPSTFPVLYDFSEKFVTAICEHLDNYIRIQRGRCESWYYRIFPGESSARANELALAFLALIDAVKTQNYTEMLDNLSVISENARSRSGSVLHKRLSAIVLEADNWKKKHIQQYHAEYNQYQALLNDNPPKVEVISLVPVKTISEDQTLTQKLHQSLAAREERGKDHVRKTELFKEIQKKYEYEQDYVEIELHNLRTQSPRSDKLKTTRKHKSQPTGVTSTTTAATSSISSTTTSTTSSKSVSTFSTSSEEGVERDRFFTPKSNHTESSARVKKFRRSRSFNT